MADIRSCTVFPTQWKASRCPHCAVQLPKLTVFSQIITKIEGGRSYMGWATYYCATCAGVILVSKPADMVQGGEFTIHMAAPANIWPKERSVSTDIPERAQKYLSQAIGSLAQPDASIMVAGSAVDAMLKAIGLTEGSMYKRIGEARNSGLITAGMADWADEVRLAANEQRHADTDAEHSTNADAKRLVEFAIALGEFLFVLPAKVQRGRDASVD